MAAVVVAGAAAGSCADDPAPKIGTADGWFGAAPAPKVKVLPPDGAAVEGAEAPNSGTADWVADGAAVAEEKGVPADPNVGTLAACVDPNGFGWADVDVAPNRGTVPACPEAAPVVGGAFKVEAVLSKSPEEAGGAPLAPC